MYKYRCQHLAVLRKGNVIHPGYAFSYCGSRVWLLFEAGPELALYQELLQAGLLLF